MLRIFPPLKIRRLRPGLNPRTWVPEASTLTPRPPKPPTARLNINLTLTIYLYIRTILKINSDYFPVSYSRKRNYTRKISNLKLTFSYLFWHMKCCCFYYSERSDKLKLHTVNSKRWITVILCMVVTRTYDCTLKRLGSANCRTRLRLVEIQ
jgi:hypothetical protein